jgi:hypothetical protein
MKLFYIKKRNCNIFCPLYRNQTFNSLAVRGTIFSLKKLSLAVGFPAPKLGLVIIKITYLKGIKITYRKGIKITYRKGIKIAYRKGIKITFF